MKQFWIKLEWMTLQATLTLSNNGSSRISLNFYSFHISQHLTLHPYHLLMISNMGVTSLTSLLVLSLYQTSTSLIYELQTCITRRELQQKTHRCNTEVFKSYSTQCRYLLLSVSCTQIKRNPFLLRGRGSNGHLRVTEVLLLFYAIKRTICRSSTLVLVTFRAIMKYLL